MKVRIYSLVALTALLLSACGTIVVGSSTENASTPGPQAAGQTQTTGAVLIWESIGPPCETVAVTPRTLSYGNCGELLTAVPPQITDHSTRFSELSGVYAPFSDRTRAGSLVFKGNGDLVPTDAEKRAIAEWARLMFQVAQAGRTGASWGMAFTWQREGGLGGFCDKVVVYLTGRMTASDCKGYDVEGQLTASQLDQLYAWVDGLSTNDYTRTFPPETGGLELALALNGNGQKQAEEETIQAIFEFAATLYTELGYAAEAGPDVEEARQLLQDYLIALHTGDYILASTLYGGDASLLQTWNPDIGDDLPVLLQRACTQNGVQCLIPRLITYRAPDNDGGYHFYVEFNNDDRTLFRQGPCCGETSGAPVSMFPFYVEESTNGLVVTDLPPYVP